MGQPSDGGRATRSETGDGVGAGAADRASTLATKSVDKVGVSGMGSGGVWAGDEGAGGISERWATCGSGLCRMSHISCLKLGGNLAQTSG